MTVALTKLHAEVRRITPVDGFGLLTPDDEGRFVLTARHVWGTAAYRFSPDEVPGPLRTRPADVTQIAATTIASVPTNALLVPGEVGRVIVAPLPDGVLFWCAARDATPVPDDRLAALAGLGGRVLEIADQGETPAEQLERLQRVDKLDQMVPTLADTLEVQEVFHRLGRIIDRVVPHDLMGLFLAGPDRVQAPAYARAAFDQRRVELPATVDVPWAMKITDSWMFFVIEDLQAMPFPDLAYTLARLHATIRVPIHMHGAFAGLLAIGSDQPKAYDHSHVPVMQRAAEYIAFALSHQRLAEEEHQRQVAADRAARLETRVRVLTDELDARAGYRRIIGESASWRQVLTQATQVAGTETTVLLLGESGTGKEVVARYLHRASARRDGPFVALNCAALPEHLLEAELFGYERGAFTGAVQSKPGQIEQAAGGVLFLDEIGEMTLPAQAKLLRVLQEREFQRLGGTKMLRADVRVIAATNRDLRKAVERGTFREDLYYRLNVFELKLPPLRERREDILPFSEAFIGEIGRNLGKPPSGISQDARTALLAYHWPGNVRELRNILERAAILADGGLIVTEHLAIAPAASRTHSTEAGVASSTPPAAPTGLADVRSAERAVLEKALQDARFNKSVAAKALGLTRAQLYTRLKRHGLA